MITTTYIVDGKYKECIRYLTIFAPSIFTQEKKNTAAFALRKISIF